MTTDDAAVAALDAIERLPGAGSLRAGEPCGIAGLRVRRIVGFPCGWFHLVADDHVDVVRLLADARDLPVLLADIEHERHPRRAVQERSGPALCLRLLERARAAA